ncbi:MAG: hypothetical protein AAGF79_02230 [Pseudomonadota bacterium]
MDCAHHSSQFIVLRSDSIPRLILAGRAAEFYQQVSRDLFQKIAVLGGSHRLVTQEFEAKANLKDPSAWSMHPWTRATGASRARSTGDHV